MAPAASAPIVALGEDLLREVFIHLPASADLLRAAAACKPFLRAARSEPFLRRYRRRHPSACSRLLGCFVLFPNRRIGRSHFVPVSASYCSSCSSSSSAAAAAGAAADGGDFALSLLPGGGWLGQGAATWKHLDCRNGRLLLENLGSHELAVADPISRRYVSIPAPPAGRAVGYGLFADDGISPEFRVVCVSRDAASAELRALVLDSGELSWPDVAGIACQPNLAAGSLAMQANRSLYWRLEGGERMVAFSTASMELSVLDLPPALWDLRFDAIDKGEEEEDANALHLVTMTGYRVEVWAGTADGDGGMAWRQVEKSFRFHKALTGMIDPSLESYERIDPSVQLDDIFVIGVAGGLVLFRKLTHIFSIDLETKKLKRLPKSDCPGALIYPYTIAWPPSLLNPARQDTRCSGEQVSGTYWNGCEQWLPAGSKFHTLGIGAICWAIRKSRNSFCSEGKMITIRIDIVYFACVLMGYWAGLFLDDDKEKLEEGLNAVLAFAQKLVTKKQKHVHPSLDDAPGGDQA